MLASSECHGRARLLPCTEPATAEQVYAALGTYLFASSQLCVAVFKAAYHQCHAHEAGDVLGILEHDLPCQARHDLDLFFRPAKVQAQLGTACWQSCCADSFVCWAGPLVQGHS